MTHAVVKWFHSPSLPKLSLRSIPTLWSQSPKTNPDQAVCLFVSPTFRVTARREEGARRSEEVRQVPGKTFHLSSVCFPLGGSFPTIRAGDHSRPGPEEGCCCGPWMLLESEQHPKQFSYICQSDVPCILPVSRVFLPEGRRVELFSRASVGRGSERWESTAMGGSYSVTFPSLLL